jgi:hypothetical protein
MPSTQRPSEKTVVTATYIHARCQALAWIKRTVS